MIGQEAIDGKCRCEKCGKLMAEVQFYTFKDKSKTNMCKQCLTLHVDNWDPDSFLWILEKLDVPYIPEEWNVIRDKAFAANPKKMNGTSVLGKYLAKMKLKQWKNYNWADSEFLQQQAAEAAGRLGKPVIGSAEERALWEAQVQSLKEQLANGEISRAQYETLMPTEVLSADMVPTTTEEAYQNTGSNLYDE